MEYGSTIQYMQGHSNVEADTLSRLPILAESQGIEVKLNHPPMNQHHPILNEYPLYLTLLLKYQRLDQPLLKAVRKDGKISKTFIYGNYLGVSQPIRSDRQCFNIQQQL